VSSEKEIGCGERDEQIQGQHSTARSLGAGRLNDHRTNYNTGARRVPYQGAESRCCCTAVSVLCESMFLCKQMRCASAIPFEFSLRRTFGGRVRRLEDWKSGSPEGEDDSCNCRQKDHQRADDSKQSNITSESMSCFSLSLQPPLRLCRAVSKDFWKQRIAQAQSASAPRSRFDPIPIRQQI
jgi:hypothetical protein